MRNQLNCVSFNIYSLYISIWATLSSKVIYWTPEYSLMRQHATSSTAVGCSWPCPKECGHAYLTQVEVLAKSRCDSRHLYVELDKHAAISGRSVCDVFLLLHISNTSLSIFFLKKKKKLKVCTPIHWDPYFVSFPMPSQVSTCLPVPCGFLSAGRGT